MIKLKPEELKKLIVENNLATEKKLQEVEQLANSQKASFQDLLVAKKVVTEKDLVMFYAQAHKIPFIDLSQVEIPKEILKKMPEKVARRYLAVVFGEENGRYKIAMADPTDIQAVQFIEKELGYDNQIYLATTLDISQSFDYYKEGISTEISKVISDSQDEIDLEEDSLGDKINSANVQEIIQEAPIARALNIILEYAVRSAASDIHVEPRENYIHIRFRIDGILQDTMTLPKNVLSSLITRIKIISNLRIDEHRIPQDGRIKIKVGPQVVSVRVSTLPIVDGEKVVMRLLDESTKAPTLEELGYSGTALVGIKKALTKPHGMLLVTGPTGSGKSTTLYSALSMLNSVEVNISTVEDPIEYRIGGVNQTQVNPQVGMTFASGLRALLRQDPDVIMVGEIRDTETAEMGVHAALTGHVVLSTLHTNNAAGCLPRLLDMGVEPFLIASTVNAVIGQRLVRKLCPDCRQAYQVDPKRIEELVQEFSLDRDFIRQKPAKGVLDLIQNAEPEVVEEKPHETGTSERIIAAPAGLAEHKSILDQIAQDPTIINRSLSEAENTDRTLRESLFVAPSKQDEPKKHSEHELSMTLYKPVGCKRCRNTGFVGRIGIYEVLEMSEKIADMIVTRAQTDEIQDQSVEEGMITMAQDGFIKSLIGITTVEEIMRVTRE